MKKQPNAYPLRIDETLSAKIKVLAKENDRSYKGQIENILKNSLPTMKRNMAKSLFLPMNNSKPLIQ